MKAKEVIIKTLRQYRFSLVDTDSLFGYSQSRILLEHKHVRMQYLRFISKPSVTILYATEANDKPGKVVNTGSSKGLSSRLVNRVEHISSTVQFISTARCLQRMNKTQELEGTLQGRGERQQGPR